MTHMTLTNVNVYVVCRNVNDQLFTLTAELTSGQCLAWRPICGIKKRKQSQSLKKSLCRRLFLSIILQNICSPCSSPGSYVEHPVKLLNGPCGEMMICSAAVEKVKPGWREKLLLLFVVGDYHTDQPILKCWCVKQTACVNLSEWV